MSEEILDLVNEQDEVIGQLSRNEIHRQGICNFRAVHGFLVNAEGKLWIPRRTAHKQIAPNALDYSVAGHVASGESYDASFIRETAEELNLDLAVIPWRTLGKLTPADGARFFEMVYEIRSDEAPQFNPIDFVEGKWLTPQEVIDAVEGGDQCKLDLVFTIKKFYVSS